MVQTAECSWFTKSVASFPYFKPTKLADDLQCSVLVYMSQNHVNDVSSKSKAQHWHGITASPPLQRLIAGFTCGNVVTWSHRIGVTFSTYNFEHFYLEKKCIANQVIKIWTATTCRAFAFDTRDLMTSFFGACTFAQGHKSSFRCWKSHFVSFGKSQALDLSSYFHPADGSSFLFNTKRVVTLGKTLLCISVFFINCNVTL